MQNFLNSSRIEVTDPLHDFLLAESINLHEVYITKMIF